MSSIRPSMFTFLLTGVIIVASTYALYRYLFNNDRETSDRLSREEKPIKSKEINEIDKNKIKTKNTHTHTHTNTNTNHKDTIDNDKGIPMKIFFGSQSGTAEGFAFDMRKEAKKYGFSATVVDLEEYAPDDLATEKLVIFLVATYGEGEPTDNAQEFYQWLTNNERSDQELHNIDFAVFGLGNSQYEFFNEMGKQFDSELEKLGGHRLIDRGIGDEDKGSTDDQFSEWKQQLWSILTLKYRGVSVDDTLADQEFVNTLQLFSVKTSNSNDEKDEKNSFDTDYDTHWLYGQMALAIKYPLSETELRSVVREIKDKNKNSEEVRINPNLLLPFRRHHWMEQVTKASISQINEARASTVDGSTLYVEFDITQLKSTNGLHFTYKTADNLGIVTRNDHKMVGRLCKRLKVNPNGVIRIRSKNNEPLNIAMPIIVSIRNLLLWYLDITGPPKKQTFQILSQFATDTGEKMQLQEMARKGTQDSDGKFWNLVNLLEKFTSVEIDLATVIEIVRPLQPRYYTISSSNKVNPTAVSITAKMEMQISENKEIEFIGVMSNYLRQSKVGDPMQIFVQASSFRLPAPEIPVIMIAAGAGIAPFRGFLQEGNQLISNGQHSIEKGTFGHWWLFFGCRHSERDYIYKDFLESSLHTNGGCLKELKVAFSRQQNHKIYVQDLIKDNVEALYDLLINKNARVFVCGQPSMGKAVRAVFQEMLETKQKNVDINSWLKSGKYVQELW